MPLTDLEIRRSKPREKPYTLSDCNGLSLLIEPNGSKGWRFRYRFDGKPKMLSLGSRQTVYDWVAKGEVVMSGNKIDAAATESRKKVCKS